MSLILGLLDSVLGGAIGNITEAKTSEEKGGAIGGLIKKAINPVTSIVNGIIAANKVHKAKNAFVPLENFRQQAFLNDLQTKKKALEAGSIYVPQQDAIRQQGSFAMENAMKSTGGDMGTTIAALNKINRSTGRNLNELYGNMALEVLRMDNLIGQTVQSMANREYDISMGDKMQKLAEAEQAKKDAGENIMGTLHQITNSNNGGTIGGAMGGATAPTANGLTPVNTGYNSQPTRTYTPNNLLPFDENGNYQLRQLNTGYNGGLMGSTSQLPTLNMNNQLYGTQPTINNVPFNPQMYMQSGMIPQLQPLSPNPNSFKNGR